MNGLTSKAWITFSIALLGVPVRLLAGDYAPIEFWNVPNYYPSPHVNFRFDSPTEAFVADWEILAPQCPPGSAAWDFIEAYPVYPVGYPPGSIYNATYMFRSCIGQPSSGPSTFGSSARRYVACSNAGPWFFAAEQVDCSNSTTKADPELNRGPQCDPKCEYGDPINVGTGNKYETRVEYRGTGPFPLQFSWTYNSSGVPLTAKPQQLPLGGNRVHNYSQSVRRFTDGPVSTAYVSRPNGNTERFNDEVDEWVGSARNRGRLEEQVAGNGSTIGWTYFSSTGEIEHYDADGRLVELNNREGFSQVLTYGPEGRLTSVADPTGRELIFAYYSDGKLHELQLPNESIIEFTYDGAGFLASVLYPDATVRQYLYNESGYVATATRKGALTGIVDEMGNRYSSTTYDANTRATSTYLAGNVDQYSMVYTLAANGTYAATAQVATPLGASHDLDFTVAHGKTLLTELEVGCVGCTSRTSQMTYDSNGWRDVEIDSEGNITDYDYDARGLETQRIEAVTTASQRTIQTDWHPTFRVPIERRSFDSSNTLVAKSIMSYNTRGQIVDITESDVITAAVRSTAISYCEQVDVDLPGSVCPLVGLIKSIDGPRTDLSDVTNYSYYSTTDESGCDTGGSCHRRGDLWRVTNALGHLTEYTRYDRAGLITRVVDANAVVTDFEYHPRGWVTARKIRGPNAGTETDDHITDIDYGPTGLVKKITQPDGSYLEFGYDDAHRLTAIDDQFGNSIEYVLDDAGNRTEESVRDASDAMRQTLSRVYNQLGEMISLVDGESNVTDFTYDSNGNMASVADALSATTTQGYDPLDRLTNMLEDVGGIGATTEFSYDALDNVTGVTAPNGASTEYVYDGLGNLVQETSPDRGTRTYIHDAASNVITTTDARGKVTTHTYDALNRLIDIELDNSDSITFQYDTGTNAFGRLNKVTDPSGETTWAYNIFGQVTAKTHKIGTISLTTAYSYDVAGRLTTVTLPSGKVVTYGYSGQLPVSVTADSTTILSGTTYEPFGPANRWVWGFGPTHGRDYDLRGLPSIIDLAGEPVTLARDAAGQVTSASFPISGFALATDYDLLGRLSDFSSLPAAAPLPVPDTQMFTYDANGNRQSLTENGTPYSYTNVPYSNRLTSLTGPVAKSYSYDAAGNVTSDGIHNYSYDDRGRLVSVDSGAATYVHNGQGQRVKKDVNGTVTLFAYDEQGRLIGEYDAQGNALMEHVWFDGAPVAVLKGSTMYQVDTDHLGTPRVIFEGYNGAVWTWISDPFGTTPAQEYTDGTGTLFKYNLRFPGQYYDEETGLHYNYFRTYDPSIGKYLESDPIGLEGGPNTYAYAFGNPLSWVDPYGLDVTACYFPNAAAGFGHLGIGVNSTRTRGFYPDESADFLGRLHTDGVIDYDDERIPEDDAKQCTTVETTQEQDELIQELINERAQDPGKYNLVGRNCGLFVADVLKKAGIPVPSDTPAKLYESIKYVKKVQQFAPEAAR